MKLVGPWYSDEVSSFSSNDLRADERLRIAAIRFLNPAPLMWDFEHEPLKTELATRYRIEWMMPSACAERLALPTDHPEAADIGLVPVAALATIPGLKIIPGCTIASKHKVRSILLVRRATQPLHTIRTVAADTSSRASLAYTRILFKRWWAADPQFIQHPPDLDLMLKTADAALLIGDPALFALEDKELRETRTSEKLIYHDLAEEWIALTGVPWISAVWAMRGQTYEDALHKRRQPSLKTIVADFQNSRDHGQRNTEALVKEWSPRLGLPAATVHTYLTENIHYTLDQECMIGLRYFYQLAAETAVLPHFTFDL